MAIRLIQSAFSIGMINTGLVGVKKDHWILVSEDKRISLKIPAELFPADDINGGIAVCLGLAGLVEVPDNPLLAPPTPPKLEIN